jgi:PAS domain S-box-containing protein
LESVKPCVVVVNDDLVQLATMARMIEQDGAEVLSFSSAEQALAYVARSPHVDLIITDLNMPGIDGWRFCRLLRSAEFPQTNRTPIMVVSATHPTGEVEQMARSVGLDAFLAMPYTSHELRASIRALLQSGAPSARPLVLIVEDGVRERQRLAAHFDEHGYRVFQAVDGEQACALFQAHRPDVVVLGHHPPHIDGCRLVPQFKQSNGTGGDTVVIAVTCADAEASSGHTLAQHGADVCVQRPLDEGYLVHLAVIARQRQTLLQVGSALQTWSQDAMRSARHIQQINDCFLSLAADYAANIQKLTQAAGRILGAACAFYNAKTPGDEPAYWQASQEPFVPGAGLVPAPFKVDRRDEGSPLVIRHLQASPYAQRDPRIQRYGLRTYVECPVLVQARSVGALGVAFAEDKEPSEAELNTLQMLARAIAAQEQMRQRDRELTVLGEIGRVVTSTLPLEEMLTVFRSKVRDVIDAEACSIALIDPGTGELVFHQADAPLAEAVVGRRLTPGQGIAGQVAQSGRSELIPDAQADPRFYSGVDEVTGFCTREVICAPLLVKDRAIGVLELLNKRQGQFTGEDLRLVESVAAQTASAIENARLHAATARELAERIKAERALRESTQRLQTFIDAAPDWIYLKDRELRYLLVNRAFAERWSVDQAGVVGQTDLDLMAEAEARANREDDLQALEEGRMVISESVEGDRFLETRRVPVLDDEGRIVGLAGIVRDITDRHIVLEQLIREQKEESILTLAGGIAHDFNNALVGIVGNVDILRMELPKDAETREVLDAMERSSRRMVALTNQLLDYAGGVNHPLQTLDLNQMIATCLETIRDRLDPDVAIEHKLADNLWPLHSNPTRIRQALNNLLINACESMAERGGTLSIATENVHRERWVCRLRRSHPTGDYVHLIVADSGHGIGKEIQSRLFEPFFSTRFLGRGLGLAVALGVVRDHQGCIEIESEPGRGTTVHIYLPRSQQGDQPQPMLWDV